MPPEIFNDGETMAPELYVQCSECGEDVPAEELDDGHDRECRGATP